MVTKHVFSHAERYAVYKTHGGKCYIGGEPIDMLTFEVDHVIPEALLDSPTKLADALTALGRPATFDLNSFENWLPACRPCNRSKSDTPWEPSLLVQLALQRAAAKADDARTEMRQTISKQQVGRALATLYRHHQDAGLSEDEKVTIWPLVADYAASQVEKGETSEVVRVTPDYAVPLYEVISDNGMVTVVRGPYGVGGGPSSTGREVPPAMRCGVCGNPYFNGARCVVCGTMDDD